VRWNSLLRSQFLWVLAADLRRGPLPLITGEVPCPCGSSRVCLSGWSAAPDHGAPMHALFAGDIAHVDTAVCHRMLLVNMAHKDTACIQ